MKILRQIRDNTPRALAREQIRRLIATGGYRRGDQLPTYEEMCDRLGVSLLTVQRAMGDLAKQGLVYRLHGKGCYVGKAITTGPRPLSQVGLVFSASVHSLLQTPYLNLMLTGMLDACTTRNIDLTILSLRTAQGRIPPATLAAQVDAVALMGIANEAYVRDFSASHAPLVIVDNHFPDIQADTVVVDNAAAVRLIMRHLLDLGHRRIAYVTGGTGDPLTNQLVDSSDARERRLEYVSEMTAAEMAQGIHIVESGGEKLATTLSMAKGPLPPTALVIDDLPTALEICRHLTANGLRVPEDISVAGVVGSAGDTLSAGGIQVTHCKADFHAMGVRGIELLVRRCRRARPPKPVVCRVPVEFRPGTSTTAPPAKG